MRQVIHLSVNSEEKPILHPVIPQDIYEKLQKYIKDIQFGSVTLIIQDGRIIQIEKNEKVRFR